MSGMASLTSGFACSSASFRMCQFGRTAVIERITSQVTLTRGRRSGDWTACPAKLGSRCGRPVGTGDFRFRMKFQVQVLPGPPKRPLTSGNAGPLFFRFRQARMRPD